jgi:hypothetical protein
LSPAFAVHTLPEAIASQLTNRNDPAIPWFNIVMTEDQRKAAGIFDALRNRPGRPEWLNPMDDAPIYIEDRIPADDIREDFFATEILSTSVGPGLVLVILGDMHAAAMAEKATHKGT